MTREEVVRKHKTYNLQSWSAQGSLNPKAIKRAEGIYLYDYDGTRYSDMSAQLGEHESGTWQPGDRGGHQGAGR